VLTVGLIAGGVALFGGVAAALGNQIQPQPVSQTYQSSPNYTDQPTVDTQFETPTATNQVSSVPQFGSSIWSPDLSYRAAIDSKTNNVALFRDQDQQPFQTIHPSNSASYAGTVGAQWSPNGQQIIIYITNGGGGQVWDIKNSRQILSLPPTIATIAAIPIQAVWSPNGRYIATSYSDPSNVTTFALFDTSNGQQVFHQTFSTQAATSLAWTPDGRSILIPVPRDSNAIGSTWVLEIWDSQAHQQSGLINDTSPDLDTMLANVVALTISPLTSQIAFIYDYSIWLGKLSDTHSIHQFINPQLSDNSIFPPNSVAWSPNEKYLALLHGSTLDYGNTLSVWDVSNGQSVPLNSAASQGNINVFAWSADGHSITVVDKNDILSKWSIG